MPMNSSKIIAGIEGGGTKFSIVLVEEPAEKSQNQPIVLFEGQYATTTPEDTLGKITAFIQSRSKGNLQAVGFGSFGPLDLDVSSPHYGQITTTTKPGWSGANLAAELEQVLQVPVYIDTDVNAAAVGEFLWGSGQGISNLLYLTIGTGIGGGMVLNGVPHHGLNHLEMGHLRIPHDWDKDPFNGVCPYHGDCFEGLASGPALLERWESPGESLAKDHPAWSLEAEYLASALVNYALTLSPQRIILGGGIMLQSHLFPMVRERFLSIAAGYISHPLVLHHIEDFIVPPGLGNNAGVFGAVGIAMTNRWR